MIGAQPNRLIAVSKNILHYEGKLVTDATKLQHNLQRQPSLTKYDMLYGGEIANGSPTNAKAGKKQFPQQHYNSEINKTNALKRDDESPTHLLTVSRFIISNLKLSVRLSKKFKHSGYSRSYTWQ